jgi:uncharacterized membrane protein (UPF0127 family)
VSRDAERKRILRVCNVSKDTSLGDHVDVADSSLARLVGLLGKKSLAVGAGLWIMPSNGVHTIGMMFAIDVILIDRHCRVVGVRENLRPFRITKLNWHARSVLEVPVGTIRASRTEVGDHLSLDLQ